MSAGPPTHSARSGSGTAANSSAPLSRGRNTAAPRAGRGPKNDTRDDLLASTASTTSSAGGKARPSKGPLNLANRPRTANLQRRQNAEQSQAVVRAGSSSSSSSPEPLLNILGSVEGDPFDISPIPSERHSRELLSLYVGTDAFTTASVEGSHFGRRFETDMRRERWFPLALRSRASYAGLIAYLESDSSNPIFRKDEVYRRHYLSIGMEELNQALRDPKKVLENETAFAILMFLMVALQTKDYNAVRFHAYGLYRLICQRAAAAGQTLPPIQLREKPAYEDTGIPNLLEHGLISKHMAEILRCNLILSEFTSAYSRDYVAGFGTGHHIWKSSDFPKEMNPLEQGIMDAYRIHIRRVATRNPLTSAPNILTQSLMARIKQCDMKKLWDKAPFILMWMALIAGPASEGSTYGFFVWLLKQSQQRTFTFSFQQAVQTVSQLYFWSPVLNTATEQHWDQVISTSQIPRPLEGPVEGDSAGQSGLDRPLTLQGEVAIRGPQAKSKDLEQ